MVPSGMARRKNTMVLSCVLALMVLLLMATQTAAAAAAAAGDDGGKARRLLVLGCRYRACNCRTCSIYGWACCVSCC
ncbi:hypothetical protein PAHAL_2G220300 [Panicum hallii]|jgi:hypothetical protein|uniref:Uncharacterized protein n=1 Tax=Panicum hallii TaxID=206008 RepID=A0A2S3GYR4_9POAL|nr:hypothetical protein PAHAL_2G220300 [Panicum hallii]PAN11829.1 hypothetical protein PAHAL_2G220300 [Panicum hallii]